MQKQMGVCVDKPGESGRVRPGSSPTYSIWERLEHGFCCDTP